MKFINALFSSKNASTPSPSNWTRQIADKLQSFEGKYSNRQKAWFLSIIGILVAVFFGSLLRNGLKGRPGLYKLGNKTVITPLPAYSNDNKELQWIIRYNKYLDSLKSDSFGVKIYYQMRRERPGLLDTIEMAGELLKQQN
ncbi:hypothetical protein [Chitinophaga rhizophila]|uniref:Uncharacterized protein n=1 Tax=Chitinophaga rhizophila TaxID=2866212 RepID=A0ABS7GA74_9BACT|nr:hypothetical protein [Chitinophaga rhizophila]MBW8683443.1 hypothetical protein [Chitinophaga rhizophila]